MTYAIVVGFEGSPHSAAGLRWALAEAQRNSGRVTAVFCWQMPFLSFPGAFDREELEKVSKEFLIETVSEIAASPQVPLQTLVAEGDPTETLIAASKDAEGGSKSNRRRKVIASAAPASRSIPASSHSMEIGPR